MDETSQGSGRQVVRSRTPKLQVVLPEALNPESHEGLHCSPSISSEAQSPCAPFSGGLNVHPRSLHRPTWVTTPNEHSVDWEAKYPLSHSGTQLDPLAKLALQFPAPMACAIPEWTVDASHVSPVHTVVLIWGAPRDPPRTCVEPERV